ncbi:MAG: MBL fold metallo-hydrolase [Turicibacter sp.]
MEFLDYVDAMGEILSSAHWTDFLFLVIIYFILISILRASFKKNKRKVWYNYLWLVACPPVGIHLVWKNRKIKKVMKKRITYTTLTIICAIVASIGIYFGWVPEPEYAEVVTVSGSGLEKRLNDLELSVHYIDVGQGDATLIVYDDFHILIDGANNGQEDKLLNYLERVGVDDIEILVATHPDADHIGGLPEVLETYRVDLILDSGEGHTSKTYKSYYEQVQLQVEAGATHLADDDLVFYLSDDVRFEIIETGDDNKDRNNNSVVAKLSYHDIDFLFTGDMESGVEKQILNRNLEAEILKVGHHGSKSGTSVEFLDVVQPEIAIISAGLNNTYGHPNSETMNRLQSVVETSYITFERGNIVVKTDGFTYGVACDK